jgi:hypothetical protein
MAEAAVSGFFDRMLTGIEDGEWGSKRILDRGDDEAEAALQQLQTERFSEAERRAINRLGSTVYELVAHYVQLATIISAHPSAAFWTDTVFFGWLRWLSVDLFRFKLLEVPNLAISLQLKLAILLLPTLLLYWLSELFWSDQAAWRVRYIDEWEQTKRRYQPLRALWAGGHLSSVTTASVVFLWLLVLMVVIDASTALVASAVVLLLQRLLGGVQLLIAQFARVSYCELRHDDEVDDRPEFFFSMRRAMRHYSMLALNAWYLPLCVGMFTCLDDVRRHILIGSVFESREGQRHYEWSAALDRWILVLVCVEVFALATAFIIGIPALMFVLVHLRMDRFVWAVEPDAGSDDDAGVRAGETVGSRNASTVEAGDSALRGGGAGEGDTAAAALDQLRDGLGLARAKGHWLWKDDLALARPMHQGLGADPAVRAGSELFALEDRVARLEEMWSRMPFAVRVIAARPAIGQRVPTSSTKGLRWLLPPSYVVDRCMAVAQTIAEMQRRVHVEKVNGMEAYEKKWPDEKGVDALWLCSRQGMVYWKIWINYIEKGFLYFFSNGLLAALIDPDTCSSDQSFEASESSDMVFKDPNVTLGGSGSGDVLERASSGVEEDPEDFCLKVGAVGVFSTTIVVLLAELCFKPYLNAQEDTVEALCRLASTCMGFVLVALVFDFIQSSWVLGLLLLVPSTVALTYAIYVLNPGVLMEHLVNEARIFMHKRSQAQARLEALNTELQHRFFDIACDGSIEKLNQLLAKHEAVLDVNWQMTEIDKYHRFTAIHVAAAKGNLQCLERILSFGLIDYDPGLHEDILTPVQLAWQNGCGRCVAKLVAFGFCDGFDINGQVQTVDNPQQVSDAEGTADAGISTSGIQLLKANAVPALISAGHHPERASDMAWILNKLDAHDNPHGHQQNGKMQLDHGAALKIVFATLVVEHQWHGLAALAEAIDLDSLELWDEWVNYQVIQSVSKTAKCLELLKVDCGSMSVKDLATVATDVSNFGHTCVVFHGTPTVDSHNSLRPLATSVDGAPEERRKVTTARDLIKKFAYGETSWSIAGTTRLMEYLSVKEQSTQSTKHLFDLDQRVQQTSPGDANFEPHIAERPPGARKQYRSHLFHTDDSDDPHQWVMALENWGEGRLAVLLQYRGRMNSSAEGHTAGSKSATLSCVTASMGITCTADKKLIREGSANVQLKKFQYGDNVLVAAFPVMDATSDKPIDELVEIRILDIFVMETVKTTPGCVDWRIVGLNILMDSHSTHLFSDIFSGVTPQETWRLSLQIPRVDIPPDQIFKVDQQRLVVAGLPRAFNLEDHYSHELELAIEQSFELFEAEERWVAMEFTPLLSSAARKYCHQTAARNSHEHTTLTLPTTNQRQMWVYKVSDQDKSAIDVYMSRTAEHETGVVGVSRTGHQSSAFAATAALAKDLNSTNVLRRAAAKARAPVAFASRRHWSVILRAEYESSHRNRQRCLGHVCLDLQQAQLAARERLSDDEEDLDGDGEPDGGSHHARGSFGCRGLAYRRELQRGDRSEILHIKAYFASVGAAEAQALPRATTRRHARDNAWSPDEREAAWVQQHLQKQRSLKHQHASALMRHMFIAADEMCIPDELLATIARNLQERHCQPGTTLVTAGDPCTAFVLLLDGSCQAVSGVDGRTITELRDLPALTRLSDVLLGLGVKNRQTVTATTACRYLVLDTASLVAVRCSASPLAFPAPGYHVVRKLASGAVESGGETQLSADNATMWLWTLVRPSMLLEGPPFTSISSEWFIMRNTPTTRWRLHLVPTVGSIVDGKRTILAAVILGCERGSALSPAQLLHATWSLRLLSLSDTQRAQTSWSDDLGVAIGPLSASLDGRRDDAQNTRRLHTRMMSRRGQQDAALTALGNACARQGERIWDAGCRIPYEDLLSDTTDSAVAGEQPPCVGLRLLLSVPVPRGKAGLGLQAAARSVVAMRRGVSQIAGSSPRRRDTRGNVKSGATSRDHDIFDMHGEQHHTPNPLANGGHAKPVNSEW